jgi:hypothetical protein
MISRIRGKNILDRIFGRYGDLRPGRWKELTPGQKKGITLFGAMPFLIDLKRITSFRAFSQSPFPEFAL